MLLGEEGLDEMRLPLALSSTPLIKCSREEALERWPAAIAHNVLSSGVRSAIALVEGHAYRVKGCGNGLASGFEVEVKGDLGERSLRGCCFANTAAQELYMTAVVEAALAGTGLRCANRAVAVYRYLPGADLVLAADAPEHPAASRVAPFACVFETVGDRRLGDHLLRGLEELLAGLFAHHDEAALQAAEAQLRRARHAGATTTSTAEPLWDTATLCECGMSAADMRGAALWETTRALALLRPAAPQQDAEELGALWDDAVAELEHLLQALRPARRAVVLALAHELGRECGVVAKALADAGVSWGTYPDAAGVHSNAHANNFVLCGPFGPDGRACAGATSGRRGDMADVAAGLACEPLLAPADFDMAFCREGFLAATVAAQRNAAAFPDTWPGLVQFEQQLGLRTSLAGSDFTSTGVANAAVAAMPRSSTLVCCMRDTLVAGFDRALHGADGHDADQQRQLDSGRDSDSLEREGWAAVPDAPALVRDACHALVVLALIRTFDVQS
jgi:hypothetical protein